MKCKCIKCGYEWESKKDTPPKSCPYCHSYKWQSKDTDKKEEESK